MSIQAHQLKQDMFLSAIRNYTKPLFPTTYTYQDTDKSILVQQNIYKNNLDQLDYNLCNFRLNYIA
jgi:hypothetical protein